MNSGDENRKSYSKLSISTMIGENESSSELATNGHDNEHDESLKLLSPRDPVVEEEKQNEDDENMEFYYSDYEDEDSDEDDDEDDDDDGDGYAYDVADAVEAAKQHQLQQKMKPKYASSMLADQELPSGWERHEDELGPYFWHIPTGTIQREKPVLDTIDKSMIRSDSLVFLDKSAINVDYNPEADVIEEEEHEDSKKNHQDVDEDDDDDSIERKSLLSKKKVVANLRLTFPTTDDEATTSEEDTDHEKDAFLVHSLGWLPVDESQINQQTGAMVIKKCIFELANRSESAARAWETQSLVMKLTGEQISLIAPGTDTPVSVQVIREIRMWGVDEQNNFAYVVRDKHELNNTSVKCYVFHCEDTGSNEKSAHKIALYLKEALMRIKNKQAQEKAAATARPTRLFEKNGRDLSTGEFPTPLEEPKIIPAFYMGMVPVAQPSGVGVLNHAIEELVTSLKLSLAPEDSESTLDRPVNVHISPATILVECRETGASLLECRVRYLSFLGISLDSVSRCGFIMQVDDGKFIAHCFHCYPTARMFCKTIEAACKLRYQKCIDSHRAQQQQQASNNNNKTPTKVSPSNSISTPTTPVQALKSSISSLFSRIVGK